MKTGYIDIEGLQFFAYHGVLEQEKRVGNRFEVSLRLCYDASKAVETDNLDYALNYAAVVEVIAKEMDVASELLEHVAGRIERALVERFPQIISGRVCIVKPHPPIGTPMKSVSFTIEF